MKFIRGLTLVFVYFFFVAPAFAQSAQDCAALMKFGIYDKFQSLTTEYEYEQIQDFFKENQFSSASDAESKAQSLGLSIPDILSLNFDGHSSQTDFSEWSQSFEKSTYQEAVSEGLQAVNVQQISSTLTSLVATCLNQKGVHAYIIPSGDNQTFSVTLDFVPYSDSHPNTQGSFTITPSSVAATCSPADLIGKSMTIGPQGISVSCRRLPTDTVVVTTNTSDGSPVISYGAYVAPQPVISFSANPTTINAGQSTNLSWNVTDATSVNLAGIIGSLPLSGTMTVSPPSSQNYNLSVTGEDGKIYAALASVTVTPPPPTLTGARVHFYTTDNDKDGDTYIAVSLECGGTTVGSFGGTFGHWDDNSDQGWINMTVVSHPQKSDIQGTCDAKLVESPNGHDEWHFNWSIHLDYSDGSSDEFDLGAGNVDYDRNTIVHPL